MAIEVIMPQMGESIVEGTITKWLKKAGETVLKDEPLFEISTDKVDAEIPSPAAGLLSEIKVAEGETVTVNTVVAIVTEAGSAVETVVSAPTSNAASSAGTEVVMPQMGESIFEGTITRWLKQVGERIEKDEPLFEISTDKVDAEIPAPVSGIISSICVGAGETVTVNTVVAVIGGAADGGCRPAPSGFADPEPAASASAAPAIAASETVEASNTATQEPLVREGGKLRSSPLVRKIAKENKVDLRFVPGSGSGGRITKTDVLGFIANPPKTVSASSSAKVASSGVQKTSAAPQVPQQALIGQTVPLTRMRAIIADRMVESKRTAPHAHTVYKIDMTRIVRLREKLKGRFEQSTGVKLTYMPFIAAAAVETLRRFPILNSSLVNGSIQYHRHVNLGIAVALEWGLIVPVIKQAEEKSFLGLARAISDLAERARTKKLLPDEASGSTFTLTNSGVFGGEFGTPVLNQPEAGILAIGGLKKEPVVISDPEGGDSIAIRSMQYYCLGFDHRTVDGGDAGKFMSAMKTVLEGWDQEIL